MSSSLPIFIPLINVLLISSMLGINAFILIMIGEHTIQSRAYIIVVFGRLAARDGLQTQAWPEIQRSELRWCLLAKAEEANQMTIRTRRDLQLHEFQW
jgi:hypothetical protein